MFKTAAALSAILAVGSVGVALAEDTGSGISGTIQSIDENTRTITLDNGKTYTLSGDQHVSTLRAGNRINLSCDDDGANCMVSESGTTGETGPSRQSEEETTQPAAGAESGEATVDPGSDTGSSGQGQGDANQPAAGTESGAATADPGSDTGSSGPSQEEENQPAAGAESGAGTVDPGSDTQPENNNDNNQTEGTSGSEGTGGSSSGDSSGSSGSGSSSSGGEGSSGGSSSGSGN
jgi:hypothetical protein